MATSSSFRQAGRFLESSRRLSRGSQLRDRALSAESELSPAQWHALDALWERGALSMNELAEELRSSQSTLTRIVDQLEKKNLARRRPAREDRRKVEVQLTPQGEESHEQLEDSIRGSCREILSLLPAPDRERALDGLEALALATQRWVDRRRTDLPDSDASSLLGA